MNFNINVHELSAITFRNVCQYKCSKFCEIQLNYVVAQIIILVTKLDLTTLLRKY